MSKLIIVLSIFALVILMIQNFKLKRSIRETEKTIDELEEDRIEKKSIKIVISTLGKKILTLLIKWKKKNLNFLLKNLKQNPYC